MACEVKYKSSDRLNSEVDSDAPSNVGEGPLVLNYGRPFAFDVETQDFRCDARKKRFAYVFAALVAITCNYTHC